MSELSADEARKTSTWVDEGVKEKEEGVMTADRERGGGEEVRSDDMSNAFRVENDLADSKHGGRDSEIRVVEKNETDNRIDIANGSRGSVDENRMFDATLQYPGDIPRKTPGGSPQRRSPTEAELAHDRQEHTSTNRISSTRDMNFSSKICDADVSTIVTDLGHGASNLNDRDRTSAPSPPPPPPPSHDPPTDGAAAATAAAAAALATSLSKLPRPVLGSTPMRFPKIDNDDDDGDADNDVANTKRGGESGTARDNETAMRAMLSTAVTPNYELGVETSSAPPSVSSSTVSISSEKRRSQKKRKIVSSDSGGGDRGENDIDDDDDDDDDDDEFPDLGADETTSGKKNYGRWHADEHALFLEGLKEYGKEWKKIATRVQTRTLVQIRTHAQKYFLKMFKAQGGKPPGSGRKKKKKKHLGDGYSVVDGDGGNDGGGKRGGKNSAKKRRKLSAPQKNSGGTPPSSKGQQQKKSSSEKKSKKVSRASREYNELEAARRKLSTTVSRQRVRPFQLKIVNPDKLEVHHPPLQIPKTPVSTKAKGRTPLHVAVLGGKVEVAKALLASYIDTSSAQASEITLIDKQDKRGYTALMIAASLSDESKAMELVTLLLENDANFLRGDLEGLTALHWAASVGNVEVVRFLLSKGCPKDILSQTCETALHRASRLGRAKVVKVLLEEFRVDWKIRNTTHRGAFEVAGSFDDATSPAAEAAREVRRQMRESISELRTLVVHHDECLNHVPRGACPWEAPPRITAILGALRDAKTFEDAELAFSNNFERATIKELSRVHSEKYIRFVFDLAKTMQKQQTPVPFTPKIQRSLNKMDEHDLKDGAISDTSFSKGSLDAALRAAGAVCHAIDNVVKGTNRNAFCVVRPPGHHAGVNGLLLGSESCGFCIFNNVAIGALYALTEYRDTIRKVAIIDFDVHHGNGTEEVVRYFSDSSKVLFISIHLFLREEEYEFYPGSGETDFLAHNVVNIPVDPIWIQKQRHRRLKRQMRRMLEMEGRRVRRRGGIETTECQYCGNGMEMGKDEFMKKFQSRVLPALRSFNPDLIMLSAGFDAGKSDVGNAKHAPRYQTGMDMQPQYYASLTEQIMYVADICCEGRVVSTLEGGYGRFSLKSNNIDRSSLAQCTAAHVGVLSGQCRKWKDIVDDPDDEDIMKDDNSSDSDDEKIRYCTCGTDGGDGGFMIECSNGSMCNGWVHPSCVGLDISEHDASLLKHYVCSWCRAMAGPALASPKRSKGRGGGRRRRRSPSGFGDDDSDEEASKSSSRPTIEELRKRLRLHGLDASGRRVMLEKRLEAFEKEQVRNKSRKAAKKSGSSNMSGGSAKKRTSKSPSAECGECGRTIKGYGNMERHQLACKGKAAETGGDSDNNTNDGANANTTVTVRDGNGDSSNDGEAVDASFSTKEETTDDAAANAKEDGQDESDVVKDEGELLDPVEV
eukprot:g1936.t1